MWSFRPAGRKTLLISVDLIIVELTTLLAFWIMAARAGWRFDGAYLLNNLGWFVFLPALWFLSAFLNDLYAPKKSIDLAASASSLFFSIILVIVVYFGIYFFATPGEMPRGIVGYQGAASLVFITLWRVVYMSLFRHAVFARKVVIVGAGQAGQTIAQTICQYARTYYRVLGFVDDDPAKLKQLIPVCGADAPLSVVGTARDLPRLLKDEGVPEVILAVSHSVGASLFQSLLECKEQGAQITLMPALYEELTGMIPVEHIGDHWNAALPLDAADSQGFYPIAKRLVDTVGALIGLILFLPLLPWLALAITLDSRGPVFYTQTRVGKGGRVFNLLKLRTMVSGAEADGEVMRTQLNDARITRVGRWLRKTRLDEMPQLLNILKGDMSAVGPRPERPEYLAELERVIPFHRLRHAVKPGMAGWAVVNYDYVDSTEDARIRLQYDLYYIKHQSLWLDLIILLRTMGHMLLLKGR